MLRRMIFLAAAIAAVGFAAACGRSEAPAPGASEKPGSASQAKSPFGFLNTPAEGQLVSPGMFVSGWALSASGIADVSVTFDDGQVGSVKTGVDSSSVQAQYPSYPDAGKAAYIFAIPKMAPGPHSLTVTVKAHDGHAMTISRHFRVS